MLFRSNDTATTEIYTTEDTLSLHDALPFSPGLTFWDAWYRGTCPTLLLRGEYSEVFPEDVAQTMLDVRPDTRLAEIPKCGHVPSLMNEDEAALVGSFLQDGGIAKPERRRDPPPPLPARAA